MSWQQWVLVLIFASGALATVASVGKPREPMSATVAWVTVLCQGLLIWMVATL